MITMNRPDGDFGPQYNHDLTTSFEDIILIPLPCWLFLLAMGLFFIMSHRAGGTAPRVSAKGKHAEGGEEGAPMSSDPDGPAARRHLRLRWTTYVFFLFAAGVLVLSIDEIARLAILGWGVGLLPFLPVTTIIATALYLTRYRLSAAYQPGAAQNKYERDVAIRILVFWLAMMVVETVKLHTLVKLSGPFPRKDSKYPIDQQVLDVGVLIGCMGVVFLLTLVEMLHPAMTVR